MLWLLEGTAEDPPQLYPPNMKPLESPTLILFADESASDGGQAYPPNMKPQTNTPTVALGSLPAANVGTYPPNMKPED